MLSQILVFGASGQIGGAICKKLGKDVIGLTSSDLDFKNPDKIAAAISHYDPKIIINAAAYTAVDLAEKEESIAHLINAESPKVLAAIAKAKNIPLIHFSTDYVFSGEGTKPWTEGDKTSPINAYGRTKLDGEKMIAEVGGKYLIFRTSWVFSHTGKNFVNTMLRMGDEKEVISVVNDQIGSPSYAEDIAAAVLQAIDKALEMDNFPTDIYHLRNSGETNWFEFAEKIFSHATRNKIKLAVKEVKPIKTSQFPTPAKRPLNSRLNTAKLEKTFGVTLPNWEDALERCIKEIAKKR